jgi:hypothetical protein
MRLHYRGDASNRAADLSDGLATEMQEDQPILIKFFAGPD